MYYFKLSLFTFFVLVSVSIPIALVTSQNHYIWPWNLFLSFPCSLFLLRMLEKRTPGEILPIVTTIAYVSLIVTSLLSFLGFGPLMNFG
jgi:hypothetical protein